MLVLNVILSGKCSAEVSKNIAKNPDFRGTNSAPPSSYYVARVERQKVPGNG